MTQESLASSGPRQSERLEESGAEFGAHHVVEDRVDGRVEVQHHATEIERLFLNISNEFQIILINLKKD